MHPYTHGHHSPTLPQFFKSTDIPQAFWDIYSTYIYIYILTFLMPPWWTSRDKNIAPLCLWDSRVFQNICIFEFLIREYTHLPQLYEASSRNRRFFRKLFLKAFGIFKICWRFKGICNAENREGKYFSNRIFADVISGLSGPSSSIIRAGRCRELARFS